MVYGYARVSFQNTLEEQERLLQEKGATKIYKDNFTGVKNDRPEFEKLIANSKKVML